MISLWTNSKVNGTRSKETALSNNGPVLLRKSLMTPVPVDGLWLCTIMSMETRSLNLKQVTLRRTALAKLRCSPKLSRSLSLNPIWILMMDMPSCTLAQLTGGWSSLEKPSPLGLFLGRSQSTIWFITNSKPWSKIKFQATMWPRNGAITLFKEETANTTRSSLWKEQLMQVAMTQPLCQIQTPTIITITSQLSQLQPQASQWCQTCQSKKIPKLLRTQLATPTRVMRLWCWSLASSQDL